MTLVARISLELPFVLRLPDDKYEVSWEGTEKGLLIRNGMEKLVRWQRTEKEEKKLVNYILPQERERLLARLAFLRHGAEPQSFERSKTVVMLSEELPPDRYTSAKEWLESDYLTGKENEVLSCVNKLLDAYRLVSKEEAARKVHRIALVNATEFVAELFCNECRPENYLYQKVLYREMDEDEFWRRPVLLIDAETVSRIKTFLLTSSYLDEDVALFLDARSYLLRDEYRNCLFLLWAATDQQLNRLYHKLNNDNRAPDRVAFKKKVCGISKYTKDDELSRPTEDEIRQLMAAHDLRNRVIHKGYQPKEEEVSVHWRICLRFVQFWREFEKGLADSAHVGPRQAST